MIVKKSGCLTKYELEKVQTATWLRKGSRVVELEME